MSPATVDTYVSEEAYNAKRDKKKDPTYAKFCKAYVLKKGITPEGNKNLNTTWTDA